MPANTFCRLSTSSSTGHLPWTRNRIAHHRGGTNHVLRHRRPDVPCAGKRAWLARLCCGWTPSSCSSRPEPHCRRGGVRGSYPLRHDLCPSPGHHYGGIPGKFLLAKVPVRDGSSGRSGAGRAINIIEWQFGSYHCQAQTGPGGASVRLPSFKLRGSGLTSNGTLVTGRVPLERE